jgi:isoleucyl-tRNA synthetase
VHLALFPEPSELTAGLAVEKRKRLTNWDGLMAVRDQVLKVLETARADKMIGKSLEARARLKAGADFYPLLEEYRDELPAVFIVSQVVLEKSSEPGLSVRIERAEGDKCERCWKYTTEVGQNADFPTLCAACQEAVLEILGE